MPAVDRNRVTAALPDYAVGRELGSSAFGLVYAGHHLHLDRDVAIKVLSVRLGGDVADGRAGDAADAVADFNTQAWQLGELDHPHIAVVRDFVGVDDLWVLVTDLVPGGSLAGQQLSPEGTVAVGVAVADGLAFAHERGVLHRDLKPDNIRFTTTNQPKITDFGVAKILAATSGTSGSLVGSPQHLAPEQITGGPLGPPADLYALAVVLYEQFTGGGLFDPTLTVPELFRHHCEVPPPRPAGVPGPVADVLLRALAKNPADRQATAHEFATGLAAAAATAYGPDWAARSGVRLEVSQRLSDVLAEQPAAAAPDAGADAEPDAAVGAKAEADSGTGSAAGTESDARPDSDSDSEPAPEANAEAEDASDETMRISRRTANPAGATVQFDRADGLAPPPPAPVAFPLPISSPSPGYPFGAEPEPEPVLPAGQRARHRRNRRLLPVAAFVAAAAVAAIAVVVLGVTDGPSEEASDPPASPSAAVTSSSTPGGAGATNPPVAAAPPTDDQTMITTFAGTGEVGATGDGGPAVEATFARPYGPAVDADGNLYVPDFDNHRIRRIDPAGVVTTVAGTGEPGSTGDGGPATEATLNSPTAVTFDGDGNMFVADTFNHRIRKVDTDGVITTVAGNGEAGTTYATAGSVVPAVEISLWYPAGVAADAAGNVYIADSATNLVRRVDSAGMISTIAGIPEFAGIGAEGSFGDGGPAAEALVDNPFSVAVDQAGNVYVADHDSHRVRRIDPAGTITTVAGTGRRGFAGDGGPATEAELTEPRGVAVDAAGNLYITDKNNFRIRRVDPGGVITTVAGNGQAGFAGDGGPGTQAGFEAIDGAVAVDATGNIYVADRGANRIRIVRVGD